MVSDDPTRAAWRSRNASVSEVLLKLAKSIASCVSCLLISTAVLPSKPIGMTRAWVSAMNSTICRRDRPTCSAKESAHCLAATEFALKTKLNLLNASSKSLASLTAAVSGPRIAEPAPATLAPADISVEPISPMLLRAS